MLAATHRTISDDRWEVARILVLIQGGLAVLATVETSFLGPGPVLVLSGQTAVVLFLLAAGLGRGSRRARRWVSVVELAFLLFAAIDSVLALLVTRAPLALVPTLTRVVLPVAVLAVVHQPGRRG